MGAQAFDGALLVIPKTPAQNGGFAVLDAVAALQVRCPVPVSCRQSWHDPRMRKESVTQPVWICGLENLSTEQLRTSGITTG